MQVLHALKNKLLSVVLEGFLADFEISAWQALRDVFPGKTIKGCVFHWAQAIWRHVHGTSGHSMHI